MSLYAIADLHLSTNAKTDKSMEVFGKRWSGYVEKIELNWNRLVTDSDTVVLPGDISWAISLEEALEDFKFIDRLSGQKIIGKGNHDFWWTSAAKMNNFLSKNNISSIKFLHNNAFVISERVICGTRGWFVDEKGAKMANTPPAADYNKLINREVQRLELSLSAGEKLSGGELPLLVFLHFPPVYGGYVCTEIVEVLKKYNVQSCYFGHIHGVYNTPASFEHEGITFRIISADYLEFTPLFIAP